jgi:hypothetical protein
MASVSCVSCFATRCLSRAGTKTRQQAVPASRRRVVYPKKIKSNCKHKARNRRIVCAVFFQGTSAYVCIRLHTSAHVSIRQHASAYVSIRMVCAVFFQGTAAYVSIREPDLACSSSTKEHLPLHPARACWSTRMLQLACFTSPRFLHKARARFLHLASYTSLAVFHSMCVCVCVCVCGAGSGCTEVEEEHARLDVSIESREVYRLYSIIHIHT